MNSSSGNNSDAVALVCIWRTGMMQASTPFPVCGSRPFPFAPSTEDQLQRRGPSHNLSNLCCSFKSLADSSSVRFTSTNLSHFLCQSYPVDGNGRSASHRVKQEKNHDQRRLDLWVSCLRLLFQRSEIIHYCYIYYCIFLETFSDMCLCCPRVWSKQSLCVFLNIASVLWDTAGHLVFAAYPDKKQSHRVKVELHGDTDHMSWQ